MIVVVAVVVVGVEMHAHDCYDFHHLLRCDPQRSKRLRRREGVRYISEETHNWGMHIQHGEYTGIHKKDKRGEDSYE